MGDHCGLDTVQNGLPSSIWRAVDASPWVGSWLALYLPLGIVSLPLDNTCLAVMLLDGNNQQPMMVALTASYVVNTKTMTSAYSGAGNRTQLLCVISCNHYFPIESLSRGKPWFYGSGDMKLYIA